MQIALCTLKKVLAVFLIICWIFLGMEGFKNKCMKEKFTSEYSEPCIILFWAKWCPHCTKIKAKTSSDSDKMWDMFKKDKPVSTSKGDVNIYDYEADQNPELIRKFGVKSFPTIIFVDKDGKQHQNGKRSISGWKELISNNI